MVSILPRALVVALCLSAATATAQDANPLVEVARKSQSDPNYRIPFDRIRPEHVAPAIEVLLAEAVKDRDALRASAGPRTWANTMQPLEELGDPLSQAFRMVSILESVASTPALRKEYNAALPKYSAFFSGLTLDADLAAKVKEYAETAEAKALTGPRKRLLEVTQRTFRRNGAYLSQTQRARLAEINTELSRLAAKFSQNVLDSTNAVEFVLTEEPQLAGLPESARQAAAASAKAKGKTGWRFTLQAPSLLAVLRFADDAAFREKMWRAQAAVATQGERDNSPLIARELELRREKAKLLGYQNFADFQTEERMAKSGAGVKRFLDDLEAKSRPAFEKESAEILAFRRSLEGTSAPALQPWDIAYYAEKMQQKLLSMDEEKLRPYLPVDRVMEGMFSLVNRIYGISVKPVENPAVWDPAVKFYEIRDRDGSLLGRFYADWFPRENKRPGAWMNPVVVGGPRDNGFFPHLGMISGNMTPPLAGQPALLSHREVETIFHEFGHLLHLALSRVPVQSLAGTSVAWDFVELPSQIMENFTWERASLDLFARHHVTGERLPEPLFQSLVKARTFRSATAMMRQLGLGMTDILFHTEYEGNDQQGKPTAYARNIMQRFVPATLPADYAFINSFAHVFAGGYAAGYYSYKWSEVLDADAFTRFAREGLFSEKVGDAFRRNVLERGNTDDAGKLFRDFMGRDPDSGALLKRSGLTR